MSDNWSKHWHILVYLVGLVFIGGMTFADNAAQNKTLMEHTAKLAEDDKREQADAVIQALLVSDVEDIKDDVDEIKIDVKEILKEIRKQ